MTAPLGGENGGLTAPIFKSVWLVDFEFRAGGGERHWPVCMVARDIRGGHTIQLWRDELINLRQAPFDIGSNALFVSFYAPAELGCMLELGWPMPTHILDLYAEHRVQTNGIRPPFGDSLLGALRCRGLPHISADEKDFMRDLVVSRTSWTAEEQRAILAYCASDVEALAALFPEMASHIDWPRALLRGRYTAAVARMERNGVPIDAVRYRHLSQCWSSIRGRLIAEVDRDFGVYDGLTFRQRRFADWLAKQEMAWPRLPSGQLQLDDDTFRLQARKWPVLEPLRMLRQSLNELRLSDLQIGKDSRNRAMLSPFRAITGRNQPAASKFVFGPSRWIRGLIRPAEEQGVAYIDFSSQEIAIAAALSGDERLIEAYADGDPYLAFAKQAKLVPADATAQSHKAIRDRCKEVVLGVNYGMGVANMALRAGIEPIEAQQLLQAHRRTYDTFWRWIEESVVAAMLNNQMKTVFGWSRRIKASDKVTSLMNFPMQANGAEMMRMAAIAATEAGIEVCAPVHDAFLIAAPLTQLDERVAEMRDLMSAAGRAVTGGLNVRTTAQVVRFPNRFVDERGGSMWERVIAIADSIAPLEPSPL